MGASNLVNLKKSRDNPAILRERHILESIKTRTTNQHSSTINILQQKQNHFSSHMTTYYCKGLNEGEKQKIGLIWWEERKTKFWESDVFEKKTEHGNLKS